MELQVMELIRVGLKINEDTLKEMSLEEIKEIIMPYVVEERYVVGYDKVYCDKPHYHIHFVTNVAFKTIQQQKQRKIKLGRTCKLYQAKEYADGTDDMWFGYAVKENYIEGQFTDEIKIQAGVQLEVKKLKAHHNQKEKYKKEEKKEFKEEMFEYVKKNYDGQFAKKDDYSPEVVNQFGNTAMLIIQYLRQGNRSRCRSIVERYTIEYLGKYHWTEEQEYNFFFCNSFTNIFKFGNFFFQVSRVVNI